MMALSAIKTRREGEQPALYIVGPFAKCSGLTRFLLIDDRGLASKRL